MLNGRLKLSRVLSAVLNLSNDMLLLQRVFFDSYADIPGVSILKAAQITSSA